MKPQSTLLVWCLVTPQELLYHPFLSVLTACTPGHHVFYVRISFCHMVTWFVFYFDITHPMLQIIFMSHLLLFPPLFFFFFFSSVPVCLLSSCVCVRMHALWRGAPRRGGPSPAQTNSPHSLKAMNSARAVLRKQAGPAGKADEEGIGEGIWNKCII